MVEISNVDIVKLLFRIIMYNFYPLERVFEMEHHTWTLFKKQYVTVCSCIFKRTPEINKYIHIIVCSNM